MSKFNRRSIDLLIIFRCLNSALAGKIQFTVDSFPCDFKVKFLAAYSRWRHQYGGPCEIETTTTGISIQSGKSNVSQTFQGWSCDNGCFPDLHCRLPRCQNIAFPEPFSKSGKIHVHVSLSHGEQFSRVHSPSAMWVQSVTTRGFEVCTRETGVGTNGTGVVNWLAFQVLPQIIQGAVTIDGVWTTQTNCNKVAFKQDWFAFLGNGSDFNFTLAGEAVFPNSGAPIADNNYGFCQQVDFNTTFYSSPAVLVSVDHYCNRQANHLIPQENNIITAWVEEVDLTSMRISVKDMSETESQHDPLSVSYVVIGAFSTFWQQ